MAGRILGDQWHDKANPACSDVTQERTVHVDQYRGQVIAQYGWDDYTAAAKRRPRGTGAVGATRGRAAAAHVAVAGRRRRRAR
jgi:uncharacterized iron-regulated membrane protein